MQSEASHVVEVFGVAARQLQAMLQSGGSDDRIGEPKPELPCDSACSFGHVPIHPNLSKRRKKLGNKIRPRVAS